MISARSAASRDGLRVAYVVNRYPRTSHSFIRREIIALEKQGVEVLRFSQRPLDEPLASEEDRDELGRTRVILDAGILGHALAVIAALRRPTPFGRAFALAVRVGWRSDRGLLRHIVYLAEACVLLRWLRQADADHVHAHFGTNSATVAMLCRELGGPAFSFTVHGPDEFDKPEFLGIPEKIRRAAFAVAISSFGRAQLCRWAHHQDWSKIHVVHCGVGEDLLRSAPAPVPSVRRLVCVARLSAQKGHLLLLEAAARLAAQNVEFEVVLVGDGPLRPEIEEFIHRNRLEAYIQIAGWLSAEAVRAAITRARALVLPSFAEGLPVVVMEALALNRPVIATAVAATPELVRPGVTGWLVPAGEVEALAEAMRAAVEATPTELEAMGRAGAALVAQRHDVSEEARRLLGLFREHLATSCEGAEESVVSHGTAP